MIMKTAEMVQKAFEKDLEATFSVGEIAGMTKIEMSGIDDEVYALVDNKATMFIARLLKKSNGEPEGAWVSKKSLAMTFGIRTR